MKVTKLSQHKRRAYAMCPLSWPDICCYLWNNAEYVAEHVISLPMSAWLKDEDMDYIVAAIKELV